MNRVLSMTSCHSAVMNEVVNSYTFINKLCCVFDNSQYNFIHYARKTIIHWLPVKTLKSGPRQSLVTAINIYLRVRISGLYRKLVKDCYNVNTAYYDKTKCYLENYFTSQCCSTYCLWSLFVNVNIFPFGGIQ